jgi:hypothetical protein
MRRIFTLDVKPLFVLSCVILCSEMLPSVSSAPLLISGQHLLAGSLGGIVDSYDRKGTRFLSILCINYGNGGSGHEGEELALSELILIL